jgi:hypothetical protein
MCIVHAGFSGFRKFVARKKSRCKLIGNRFVIPHDTIHSPLCHLMNKKYYSDIRNNEKLSEKKIIQRKIDKTDYEAGSGNMTTLPHNNPMKEFTRYDLIIDNIKYRIDKELFDNCNDGDEVLFYYAPKSKYLLSIEKKN